MVTEIKAYQTKCPYCQAKFVEFEPGLATKRYWEHVLTCGVLECIAIAKGFDQAELHRELIKAKKESLNED